MRKFVQIAAVLAAVVVPAAADSPDEFGPAHSSIVKCGSYAMELSVGPTDSGPRITRGRDGRIVAQGEHGRRAVASCEHGCLEATSGADCTIIRTGPRAPVTPAFTVNCPDGDTFEIERNGDGGGCGTTTDASDNVSGGSCDDGQGNRGSVSCAANDGNGRCVEESGTTRCHCSSCS